MLLTTPPGARVSSVLESLPPFFAQTCHKHGKLSFWKDPARFTFRQQTEIFAFLYLKLRFSCSWSARQVTCSPRLRWKPDAGASLQNRQTKLSSLCICDCCIFSTCWIYQLLWSDFLYLGNETSRPKSKGRKVSKKPSWKIPGESRAGGELLAIGCGMTSHNHWDMQSVNCER